MEDSLKSGKWWRRTCSWLGILAGAGWMGLIPVQAQELPSEVQEGKQLYQRCAACHRFDEDLIGPPLRGVHQKFPEDWLIVWIQKGSALAQEGDSLAQVVAAKTPAEMPPNPDLSPEQIRKILLYIAWESADSVYLAERGIQYVAPTPPPAEMVEVPVEEVKREPGLNRKALVGLLIFLLALWGVYELWRWRAMRLRAAGRDVWVPPSVFQAMRHKVVVIPAVTIGVIWAGAEIWNWGANMGHAVGYAPEQPVLFSHRVHAGIQGIDCQYCHYGVRKGRTAGIPPMEVCAGCHQAVQKSDVVLPNGKTGTEEIQKLLTYLEEKKPIEWKRVFWLPDHVFFSHYQHVVVAGIACQECHGPVEEMDIVAKEQRFSMGFCLDCHRNRAVDSTNPYYQSHIAELLEQAHEARDFVRVAQIGGESCQHCHY